VHSPPIAEAAARAIWISVVLRACRPRSRTRATRAGLLGITMSIRRGRGAAAWRNASPVLNAPFDGPLWRGRSPAGRKRCSASRDPKWGRLMFALEGSGSNVQDVASSADMIDERAAA